MDEDALAAAVLAEMATLKYAYESTIRGAVAAVAHQKRLTLTAEQTLAVVALALRDQYAPDAEISGPMHGPWTIDGDVYERGEDACKALRG